MGNLVSRIIDLPTYQFTNLPTYQCTNLPIYQFTNSTARASRCNRREHAAHVRHRLDHPGQRVPGLDLVLEAHLPLIADVDQRFEESREIDHAAADFNLAFLLALHRQILHVHVVEAVAALTARLDGIGAGAQRVTDVDAEAETFVARLHRGIGILGARPALVLWTVIVDRHSDVVGLR